MENERKEWSMNEIDKRNAVTTSEAIKMLVERYFRQQAEIAGLMRTMATLVARLDCIEQTALVAKVANVGHGPTVKP